MFVKYGQESDRNMHITVNIIHHENGSVRNLESHEIEDHRDSHLGHETQDLETHRLSSNKLSEPFDSNQNQQQGDNEATSFVNDEFEDKRLEGAY